MPKRCPWANQDPLLTAYHDDEWGVANRDEQVLFECLNLEGAQAGLSWLTVLKRREAYRTAFDGWNINRIAQYGEAEFTRNLHDPGIIRNRLKIQAVIANAHAVIKIQHEHGSLADFLWSFVGLSPIIHHPASPADIPSTIPESKAMSRALQQYGCKFVGPTICYALMQATGMVVDHVIDCFRYQPGNH